MNDGIVALFYFVAFGVSVVVIFAILQLFAIRHALDALVKHFGATVPAVPRVTANVPARTQR